MDDLRGIKTPKSISHYVLQEWTSSSEGVGVGDFVSYHLILTKFIEIPILCYVNHILFYHFFIKYLYLIHFQVDNYFYISNPLQDFDVQDMTYELFSEIENGNLYLIYV